MQRLFKYLLVMIIAAAVWSGADEAFADLSPEMLAELALDDLHPQTSFSDYESEPLLPRQITSSTTNHAPVVVRKIGGIQKTKLEFTKSGKLINAGVQYLIQNQYIILRSSKADPGQMLHSLGRLII
jgi:hypothetical protein